MKNKFNIPIFYELKLYVESRIEIYKEYGGLILFSRFINNEAHGIGLDKYEK